MRDETLAPLLAWAQAGDVWEYYTGQTVLPAEWKCEGSKGGRIQNGRCSGFLSLLPLVLRKIRKVWWRRSKQSQSWKVLNNLTFTEISKNCVSPHLNRTVIYLLPCQSKGKLLPLQFISGSLPGVVGVQSGHHGLFQHKPCGTGEGTITSGRIHPGSYNWVTLFTSILLSQMLQHISPL